MKSALKRGCWLILLVPLVLIAGFVIWASTPLGPMPEALAALQPDSQVQVQLTPWYIFQPVQGTPQAGVIFYPGGRVRSTFLRPGGAGYCSAGLSGRDHTYAAQPGCLRPGPGGPGDCRSS